MNREGHFFLKTFGKNHCGIGKRILIRYALICECRPTLDDRGFLFDQINVDTYFRGIEKSSLSCENLVMRCVEELIQQIRAENPACVINSMKLTLSPEPHAASMTYTWKTA